MTFLRIVIPLYLLFEHDLRVNASRLSRGKTGTHLPDHALRHAIRRPQRPPTLGQLLCLLRPPFVRASASPLAQTVMCWHVSPLSCIS
jgi:hypothetical protein